MAIQRRDALKQLALGSVAAAALPSWVESLSALALDHAHTHGQRTAAAKTAWTPKVLTPAQNESVIAISELILPQTSTPGAKAAKVNEFIDSVMAESKPADRTKFLDGLAWMDTRAKQDFQTASFVAAKPEQQTALLTEISVPEASPNSPNQIGHDFFEAIKNLTIIGYYTSEVGVRQELGDNGMLFFTEFKGCTHPEHQ
jgi:glucoside 3-dehydrogenase (cytochrome c) hitch-hiker subunit